MMKNSPVVRDADQLKAVTEEDANAFVGPLFPGKVVDELGIADGSLFIYGDDSEYTRRVSGKHKLYPVSYTHLLAGSRMKRAGITSLKMVIMPEQPGLKIQMASGITLISEPIW